MGRSAMLQRLGMVIEISGFAPEFLAVEESMTAQRHLGFLPICLIRSQQVADTLEDLSCAAIAQGASFMASLSGGFLPHSPAPWTVVLRL